MPENGPIAEQAGMESTDLAKNLTFLYTISRLLVNPEGIGYFWRTKKVMTLHHDFG